MKKRWLLLQDVTMRGTTDLGENTQKKDSRPAAKQHQREGLLRVFQQLHDDEGVVVKAPKCLAQRERKRGREGEEERGTPTFIALAAIPPPFRTRAT